MLLLARLRGLRLFLHHHSFAYLDSRQLSAWLLMLVAGHSAVHITESPHMAERLSRQYGIGRAVSISNAVFLLRSEVAECRTASAGLGAVGL